MFDSVDRERVDEVREFDPDILSPESENIFGDSTQTLLCSREKNTPHRVIAEMTPPYRIKE